MTRGITTMIMIACSALAAWAQPSFEKDLKPYLTRHCIRCHGPKKQKGDFRIDQLSTKIGLEDTPFWIEIRDRITSGEMPPEDVENGPSADESAAIVEWIAARLKEGEAARLAKRDKVSYNRLTVEEYVNTVRDLIGVQFDATDPGGFTEDPEWNGFERLGSVLTLSASHVEKYLTAAEKILEEAYPEKAFEQVDMTRRAIMENNVVEPHRTRLREAGLLDKVRFEMWPRDIFRYSTRDVRLPVAGIYEISYTLSGLKPPNGRAPRLHVYETKLDRTLFEQDVIAPEDQPTTVSFRAHLPAGRPTIHVFNKVPGPSISPRSGRHGRRPFISLEDGRLPWQMKLTTENGDPLYPFLILDSISWRGPIITDEEQRWRDEYMPDEKDGLAGVRRGLGNFARRAFRRPLREGELDKYLSIVQAELDAGEKFRDAVKAGMITILCSRSFLFLEEGDEQAQRNELNDWEIASRLSYLLWSTMPDEQLFAAAKQGKLRDKSELRRQFRRLLEDPRADRFVDSFSWQWLHLRKVGMFQPDEKLYPDYDDHLEQSMVRETQSFFAESLRKNLSLREFLDSDWTMLNGRLAKFYGIPNVVGDEFQRVSLVPEYNRGGLLTHASILSLTSDGTRHRPVHRGVWVYEAIFGKQPPPPPANVDPIEPNPVDQPKATLRMKLEAHIHDPNCASCHRKIDPLGLAFENYDAIGRWRTTERVDKGTGANPKVDSSGKLPDGRAYRDAKEFKQLLLSNTNTFSRTFIEKLATYGLRRTVTFDDDDDLQTIAEVSKKKDFRVRDTLEAFVLSDLFRKR